MGAALWGTLARVPPGRVAGRPVRPEADAPLDRRPVPRRVGLVGPGRRRVVVHRRPVPGRASAIGVSTVAAPLYISEIAPPGLPRPADRAVPVQHRVRHPRRLPVELPARVGRRRGRLAVDARGDGRPVPGVHARLPVHPREPPLAAGPERATRAAGWPSSGRSTRRPTRPTWRPGPTRIGRRGGRARRPRRFWTAAAPHPILLAFLVAFFNQMSGINAILYFAPRIFEMTGLGDAGRLLHSVGIGVTNLVFTFVGLWLIDRLGRRTLLYIGSFGYIASLGLCAWAFHTGSVRRRAGVHLRLHRGARGRPGGGDLGVHRGDLPGPVPGERPGAGQLRPTGCSPPS